MLMFNEKLFGKGRYPFFFNPIWIIRRGILNGILENSLYIKGNVLDFGCGEKPYKNLLSFDTYEGLDFPKTGHDNRNNDIEIFWDGKFIPRKDKTYDSFICTEVLEHIFNIEDVLTEIYRVLKIGGYGIITIPFIFGEHEIPYDFARYTFFGIEDILKRYGFKIINHKRIGNEQSVLCQLSVLFINKHYTKVKNKWLRRFCFGPFYYLLIILFNVISMIPSKNDDIYLNNIIVVKK